MKAKSLKNGWRSYNASRLRSIVAKCWFKDSEHNLLEWGFGAFYSICWRCLAWQFMVQPVYTKNLSRFVSLNENTFTRLCLYNMFTENQVYIYLNQNSPSQCDCLFVADGCSSMFGQWRRAEKQPVLFSCILVSKIGMVRTHLIWQPRKNSYVILSLLVLITIKHT